MTLGDAKTTTYKLLDEYGSGGDVDEELELKMSLFDTAQKHAAQIQPIIRLFEVERDDGTTEYAMPEDFRSLRKVWADEEPRRYRWKAGKILIPERDGTKKIEIEYNATPQTITEDTPDEYVFEVSEEAAAALPFYVAAMTLAVDLVTDGDKLMQMYNLMMADLHDTDPGAGRARQTLFRGWSR